LAAIGHQYLKPFRPVETTVANWLSPFVTTCGVDMASTSMDTPTDPLRTEQATALLTEKQVCTYLNVSKRNLYCWRMAGLIPYFKIGRAVRFRKSEVDATLERMRIG
jgi:excisionase family DNA binding protein